MKSQSRHSRESGKRTFDEVNPLAIFRFFCIFAENNSMKTKTFLICFFAGMTLSLTSCGVSPEQAAERYMRALTECMIDPARDAEGLRKFQILTYCVKKTEELKERLTRRFSEEEMTRFQTAFKAEWDRAQLHTCENCGRCCLESR